MGVSTWVVADVVIMRRGVDAGGSRVRTVGDFNALLQAGLGMQCRAMIVQRYRLL